jgi:hypothetical protein
LQPDFNAINTNPNNINNRKSIYFLPNDVVIKEKAMYKEQSVNGKDGEEYDNYDEEDEDDDEYNDKNNEK